MIRLVSLSHAPPYASPSNPATKLAYVMSYKRA